VSIVEGRSIPPEPAEGSEIATNRHPKQQARSVIAGVFMKRVATSRS